jgi:hypothetical protein
MSLESDGRTIAALFSDALNQFTALIRNEVRLARAEIANNVTSAAMGIGMLAGAGFISIAGFVLLLLALSAWLIDLGLSDPVAHLLAGIVGLAISGLIGWLGMKRLRPEEITPNRTIEQLQRDATAVREHVT